MFHSYQLAFFIGAVISSSIFSKEALSAATRLPIEERYRALESLARGLYFIENMYVDPKAVSSEVIVQHALKGVTNGLDPHTTIMPKRAFDQFSVDTQGKFGGVGVIVSYENSKIKVVSPMEGTPAWNAGIKSGDIITAIDGKRVEDFNSEEALDKMKGEVGSTITLTIKRENEPKELIFKLVRKFIKVASTRGQMLSENIAYARISSFQEDSSDNLEKILRGFNNIDGLVLDLRDNPGGLLDQAVKICDFFLDSGIIVSTVGRDPKKIEREFAHKNGTFPNFPMVVLVNGGSASASEIVAGALQDHKRALIMGSRTFGKGSVQTLISLPNGSGLKLTIARYYTPLDRSIQAKGITPDIATEPLSPSDVARDSELSKGKKMRKEADLEGHISGDDLSSFSKEPGIAGDAKSWPEGLKNDVELKTAYSYLKGFKMFGPLKSKG